MINQALIERLSGYFARVNLRYGLSAVYLYGSRAHGNFREDSDLDLAIVFTDEQLVQDEVLKRIGVITAELSAELKLEIEIIPIMPDFHKPMLYYNAIMQGVPVYMRSKDDQVDLFLTALTQMEDFSIFGPGWQKQAAQYNLKEIANG